MIVLFTYSRNTMDAEEEGSPIGNGAADPNDSDVNVSELNDVLEDLQDQDS